MTEQRQRIAKLVSEYGAESYQGGLPGREHTAYDALMTAIDSLIGDAARWQARAEQEHRRAEHLSGELLKLQDKQMDAAIAASGVK